jgi:hypothetical protein
VRNSKMLTTMLAAIVVLAFAAPASAMTVGGEVFGAFNTHTMKDWNDIIESVNQSGGNMDEVKSGFGGGLGLRMWPNSNWMIAGTWEPLFLTREEKTSGDELKLNGNSIQGTVAYFFPTAGQAKFGIGAGVGYYMLNGEVVSTPSIELKGSTVGFHFMGTGEWTVSPGFAITGTAGYRVANISDTEFDGQSTSPETETDYSGVMVRAGLAFYLPSAANK